MAGPCQNPRWETVAIFLALVSLWPFVFRVETWWTRVGMYGGLVLMVVVFLRRLRRLIRRTRIPGENTGEQG